jgi:CRP-like cAMP-binding protein
MKVRQRDRAQLLGQVPLFSYCSQRELAKVAKLANELALPAGHTLIHEDAEVAYSFFVLVDGEAEVRRTAALRPSGRATASVSWRSSCAGPEPPR